MFCLHVRSSYKMNFKSSRTLLSTVLVIDVVILSKTNELSFYKVIIISICTHCTNIAVCFERSCAHDNSIYYFSQLIWSLLHELIPAFFKLKEHLAATSTTCVLRSIASNIRKDKRCIMQKNCHYRVQSL